MTNELAAMSAEEQIKLFLTTIYGPHDFVIFDPLVISERRWFTVTDDLDESVAYILDRNKCRNAYIGVNPRRDGETGAAGTSHAVCYFADWDGIAPGEALAAVQKAGLPHPSVVVMSGSGTHAYWVLVEQEDDLEEWSHRQEWLAAALGSDDAVSDAQRLTRLPGAYNRKDKYRGNPPRAVLVKCEATRFRWADIQPKHCPEPVVEVPEAAAPKRERTNGELLPGDDFMARGEWSDVLPDGWRQMGKVNSKGYASWTNGQGRGGRKTATVSIGTDSRSPAIYIWDTDETILPANQWHSMFFAYATIHHGGDMKAATRQLAAEGYGKQAEPFAGWGNRSASTPPLLQRIDDLTTDDEYDGPELMLRPFSTIEEKEIDWLWPGRIVNGGLTIVTGAVGQTKSMLTIDLAARVSVGGRHPDGSGICPAGKVLLFGQEDSAESVVKPRLLAAQANCENVYFVDGRQPTPDCDDPDMAEAVKFSEDIGTLRRTLRKLPGVNLLVFDPLPEFINGDHNTASEVRSALLPLNKLAQELGIAIVAICHQNKKTGLSAVQTIAGSGGFTQVARTVLAVVNDPDDHETGFQRRRVMVVAKSNYGGVNQAQAYRLMERDGGRAAIEWLPDILEVDADALVKNGSGAGGDSRRTVDMDAAVSLVREIMKRSAGVTPAGPAEEEMRAAGHSRHTVIAAKTAAGVRSRKSGMAGGWVWEWVNPADHGAAEIGESSIDDWIPPF